MQAPRKPHLNAARHILPYVKSMLHYKLFYEVRRSIEVYGYIDAKWTGSTLYRRSTIGFMFSFGRGVVRWSSNKQSTIALSSTKAEYTGAIMAECEVSWLRKLLDDMD